jgi:putative endonuclease
MAETNTKALGNFYERQARKFLEKLEYEIIEQNWQCGKIGEIDFIVLDKNRFRKEFLVFVEVKYRYQGLTAAKQAVNYKKQIQLKKLASLYLKSKKLSEGKTNISYDVIAISPNEIEHIKNIFNI